MSRIDGTSVPSATYLPMETEPRVGSDESSTLAAALLRLEEDARSRRELSRGERRRSLEMRHEAIEEAKDAARKNFRAKLIGFSLKLGASAASGVGQMTTGKVARTFELASAGLGAAGDIGEAYLEHRATVARLDADATKAGAEGLSEVAGAHQDAAADVQRAADRSRELLERLLEGEHTQRMAIVRG